MQHEKGCNTRKESATRKRKVRGRLRKVKEGGYEKGKRNTEKGLDGQISGITDNEKTEDNAIMYLEIIKRAAEFPEEEIREESYEPSPFHGPEITLLIQTPVALQGNKLGESPKEHSSAVCYVTWQSGDGISYRS